jgi:hypothetical protein
MSCFRVADQDAGNVGIESSILNSISGSPAAAVGFRSDGTIDGSPSFAGFQAVPISGRLPSGYEAAFESAANLGAINGGLTLANYYGFIARQPTSVSGTLTNIYGLYIEKQKVTNVTNSWGVFQADIGDLNQFAGAVINKPTTVSALPTCNAGLDGARMYVTDQNTAVAYRGAVTGGGSTHQAVLCSSSAWIQD